MKIIDFQVVCDRLFNENPYKKTVKVAVTKASKMIGLTDDNVRALSLHIDTEVNTSAYCYNSLHQSHALFINPTWDRKYALPIFRSFEEFPLIEANFVDFVVAHELCHYKQKLDGRLSFKYNVIHWNGENVQSWVNKTIGTERYFDLPWEKEANTAALQYIKTL